MVDDEGPIANPRHLPDDLDALLEVVEGLWVSRIARFADGDAYISRLRQLGNVRRQPTRTYRRG
jgi:hypothetical protein